MIKRLTKTCTIILVATTMSTLIPNGISNEPANAAVNNKIETSVESLKNETVLAKSSKSGATDEQILGAIKGYLSAKKYPGCEVIVASPVYVPLKISDDIAKKLATKIASNDDFVKEQLKKSPEAKAMVRKLVMKQLIEEYKVKNNVQEVPPQVLKVISDKVNAMPDSKVQDVIDSMTKDQIDAVRPMVVSKAEEMIKEFDGQKVTVYGYIVMDGTTVKDKGFFVGGQIGGAIMQAKGSPLCVSGDELDSTVKNKILEDIKKNLDDIIKVTGIGSIIDKVTDTTEDLADSIGDLADSLNDKSDDIDDAWDKVFDRFDNEEGWGKRDGYIYYYDEDGISLKGVQEIDGKTYYFNRIDGALETGWQIVDGKRCYFDKKKGYQLFLRWIQDKDDWYFLDADGTVKKSDWVNDGGKKFYLKADGKMTTGWIKIDDYWYYFDQNGSMATSAWKWSDGKWYYLEADGGTANDWLLIDGKWYYFKERSGEMQTGWFRADGSWYCTDLNGAMKTGWAYSEDGWCYLDDCTGKMKKNDWVNVNGKWYYFNVNGVMVTGTRYVNGTKYKFDSDGILI